MKTIFLLSVAWISSIIPTNNPNKVIYNITIRVDSSRVEYTKIIREPEWKCKGDTVMYSIN